MMKSISKFKFLFLFILIATLISCEKKEEQYEAYGDVVIRSINRDGSVMYGVCYYAYSNYPMKEVTASLDGSDSKISLDTTDFRFTFYHLPDSLGYSTQKPPKGNYTFNVAYENGTEYVCKDILDSTAVKPPVIKEYKFDTEDVVFKLDWEAVTNADQYKVFLENEKKELVFQSPFLNASQSFFAIMPSTSGWTISKDPVSAGFYKAIVVAYEYEPVASSFDLQSISFTEGNYFQWLSDNK